jgi:DNA invertase Pin-like site-specific DNA recombinase
VKVALYARVSTDDKGQDPENQLAELRQGAERSSYEIAGEYVDEVSGRKGADKRPRFSDLLVDAHKRRFDMVLVWALDRLSREGFETCVSYVKQLSDCGVSLRSFTEPLLSTENETVRAIMFALQSSQAKAEAEKISARVKAGVARKRRSFRDGAWGTRPLEISSPEKVDAVRAMLSSGVGIGKTARTLRVGNGVVQRIAKAMRAEAKQ